MKRLAFGWSDDTEPVQFSDDSPGVDADAIERETGLDFGDFQTVPD